jgi:PLP dependent protein
VSHLEREVAARLAAIRERIAAAARRAGRDPAEVTLVGASKLQPPERLRAAAAAGLRVFGENRVQEAEEHQEVLAGTPSAAARVEWHLIGPLQSNKAKRAVELFSTVHSVDRVKIARLLDRHAGEAGVTLDCFLEVDLADEDSKSGFRPGELIERAADLAALRNLHFVGLMAIPPFPEEPEDSRPWFRKLRELSDAIGARPEWPAWPGKLSMGMSADFEIAIEEGATHVRVGTDLFGTRD